MDEKWFITLDELAGKRRLTKISIEKLLKEELKKILEGVEKNAS